MTERTVIDCDGCSKRAVSEHTLVKFFVGYSQDPIDRRSSEDFKYSHLCSECLANLLSKGIQLGARPGLFIGKDFVIGKSDDDISSLADDYRGIIR